MLSWHIKGVKNISYFQLRNNPNSCSNLCLFLQITCFDHRKSIDYLWRICFINSTIKTLCNALIIRAWLKHIHIKRPYIAKKSTMLFDLLPNKIVIFQLWWKPKHSLFSYNDEIERNFILYIIWKGWVSQAYWCYCHNS